MSKTNVFVLTCKGRKDLTEQCFKSMVMTLGLRHPRPQLIIVDAGQGDQSITIDDLNAWLGRDTFYVLYENRPCTLTEGWNRAIELAAKMADEEVKQGHKPRYEDFNIHLLQNDSVFVKSGWLGAIEAKMEEPRIGSVGTSGMSVFGHPFVTGAIQSFNLANGLAVAENGKVIDEVFNHAFPDVDLCIRFARAGFHNTVVADMEHGPDPAVRHLVSQTMYSEHGIDKVMQMRALEEAYFLQKWGRAEGG